MRRLQSISTLLSVITGLLVVMPVYVFATSANMAFLKRQDANHVLQVVRLSHDVLFLKEAVRSEMGAGATALAESAPSDIKRITDMHAKSARSLALVMGELSALGGRNQSDLKDIAFERSAYRQTFAQVIAALRLPQQKRPPSLASDWENAVIALLTAVDNRSKTQFGSAKVVDPYIDGLMDLNDLAWAMRAVAGTDSRRMATAIMAHRRLSVQDREEFADADGRAGALWAQIEEADRSQSFPAQIGAALTGARLTYNERYRGLRTTQIANMFDGNAAHVSGSQWLALSEPGLTSIIGISKMALTLTEVRAQQLVAAANVNFNTAIALMLLSIALASSATLYLMWRVIRPLRVITQSMRSVTAGDLTREIPFGNRNDEIGQFAHALQMFREGAVERHRLQTELVRNLAAKETAEKSNRIKSEFLANMSHELRTPLNAIIGFSDMIASEVLGPAPPRYREYAQDVNGAGLHLLALINDVLDLSKAEAGKLELSVEPVDLEALLKECARLMRGRAAQQDLHLTLGVAPLPQLLVDRLRIKQVILNLLSNAIKFSPAGGTVSVEAERVASGGVVVCVRDTGIGISPELIPLAFEPFRQVDSALSRKYEGTGLGLPLVKTYVELHGGAVRMESALGKGTAVFITLPASCCSDSRDVRAA